MIMKNLCRVCVCERQNTCMFRHSFVYTVHAIFLYRTNSDFFRIEHKNNKKKTFDCGVIKWLVLGYAL